LGGESLGGSPNGGSVGKGSPNNIDRPPKPFVGFYGWPTPNSRIFMPPWCPLIVV